MRAEGGGGISVPAMCQREPLFFRFHEIYGDPAAPVMSHVEYGRDIGTDCGRCGKKIHRHSSDGWSCVVERGTYWPDVMGAASHPILAVSERVVRALEEELASGFDVCPIRLAEVRSRRLALLPEPEYFYLRVTGAVDIDLTAGGIGGVPACPECFQQIPEGHQPAHRHVPIAGTWDGADFVRTRNLPNLLTFCTRRVVELARTARWTNLRIDPMDIGSHNHGYWAGVPFLGERWPPPNWYPPRPSDGRSLDEWLGQLTADEFTLRRAAKMALVDLGREAIPALAALLRDDRGLADVAAKLLMNIHSRGDPLPPAVREQMTPWMTDDERRRFGS